MLDRVDASVRDLSSAERAFETAGRLSASIESVIRGKSAEVRLVVCALAAGGHVLFDDVPGTAKTVLSRAIDFALEFRPRFEGVPIGVASLTNRPLPHAFPTADGSTFATVVVSAIGIEKPPPITTLRARVTSFAALERFAAENFFSTSSSKRAVIVLTDGESRPFDPQPLLDELATEAIEVYFVRFWHEDERVWLPDGAPERYRPDPGSEALLTSLSSQPRVRAFDESDMAELTGAVEAFLGVGPIIETAVGRRTTPLAPWLALLGAAPLALLLVRRPR